jgi:hypothetical protein
MAKMTDTELVAVVASGLQDGKASDTDEISSDRAEAWRRYTGEKYGDEREGRSQVMDRSVMETIEAIMPSLVRTFLGTDEVVRFEPEGPEDEEVASQATDYCRHIIFNDNDGFRVIHDAMKSSMIHKLGVIKTWWEETEEVEVATYEGLTEMEMQLVLQEDGSEVLSHEQEIIVLDDGEEIPSYNLEVKHTRQNGRVKIEALAPEEFMSNRRARALTGRTMTFCCHRTESTRSEAKEMGFDPKIIDSLPTEDDLLFEEREERELDTYYNDRAANNPDPSTETIWLYENYVKVDYDQTGIAKWRKVFTAGDASSPTLLDHEPVADLPFAAFCPILLPHRLYGWSMADLTEDIQKLKTALWRMQMDGLYHSVFPRHLIQENGGVNLDQYLNNTPGGYVLANRPDAITPIPSAWNGAQAFPMMEYIDRVLESRTGVTALASGLDANVLQNQSATAVNEGAQAARARIELMTRVFAETGFKELFMSILKLIVRHQDRERTIRLRNEWIPMDPRRWNAGMDMRVNVGLGTGSREQQMQRYNLVAQKQEAILQQAGPQNPWVTPQNYYNTLSKLVEAADLPDVDLYFTDPEVAAKKAQGQPQQPPPPDPKMAEVQGKMQIANQKAQADMQIEQAKLQASVAADQQKGQTDLQVAQQKAQMDVQLAREQGQMDLQIAQQKAQQDLVIAREAAAQELEVETQKMRMQHELRREEMAMEFELEKVKMAAGSPDGNADLPMSDH